MKMYTSFRRAMLVFAVVLIAAAGSVFAQEFRGSITGTVSDPNAAAVAGATVTLKNIATNITQTVTANDAGSYTFALIQPGFYTVSATGSGFKTSARENLEVKVGDRLTVDFALEIGTSAEVNILADAEILERGSVSIGNVVTEREITELPLAEGAAYNLATQSAGVEYTGNPQFTGPTANGNLAGFRTNGAVGGNQITLDGSPNSTIDAGVAFTPPADALSQFKTQTSSFDAQNGFTAGSTVNVAIKSGTNKFHGSAYYFDRSKALTSNSFFNNRNGAERPDRKYYRYGGQVNGPIFKDRTFFMFAYEKQYNKRPESDSFTVPTAKMRVGDFSELLSFSTPILIYDPATATLRNTSCAAGSTGTTVCRTPFAGNIIPTARINAASLAFLNLYPLPNVTGQQNGTVNNFFSNQTNIQPYDSYLTRVDHNINDNNRIFGKFFYSKSTEDRYNWLDELDSVTQGFEVRRNIGGSANYTSTLSSNLILDVRGSYHDFVQHRYPSAPMSAADLGFAGIAALTDSEVFPRFDFTNLDTLGAERSDFNQGLQRNYKLLSIQPTLTQVYGDHTLRYGYDFRKIRETRDSLGYNAGRFQFTGVYTSPASNSNSTTQNQVGRDVAAFLLGLPSAASANNYIEETASYDVSELYHGFFVQDDWRVNSKLTLNLGLRYEIETGLREAEGRMIVGFDTTTANPLRGAALANFDANVPSSVPRATFANLVGGPIFAADSGERNQIADKNNFQPRVGVSYALGSKTVVRGGFGIFTAPFQILAINQAGFTASTPFNPTANNGLTFLASLSNPFPNGLNPAVGSALGMTTSVGTTIGTTNATGPTATTIYTRDRKNANYKRFVASVQHELPYKIGVEATFVYSKGEDLPVQRQLNYIPREYLLDFTGADPSTIGARITANTNFLNQTVANPFRTLVPHGGTLNNATIQRRFLLTQYPHFQDLIVTEYEGSSDYRALQLQARKRITKGLSLNATYTLSRDYDRTRRLNPQDENLTEMLSPSSRPHRFTLSSVFEIPIGRKRTFFTDMHPVAEAILGGWQLNAVFERQSGEPLVMPNVYYNGDFSKLVARIGEKDENGLMYGVDISAIDRSGFLIGGLVPGYGNNYTISSQNVLRTIPYTSDNLRNQVFQKFDAGLTKNFDIREGMRLQVRVEGINALNWVYFSGIQLAPSSGSFGIVSSTQRNLPRDIQLGARFTF